MSALPNRVEGTLVGLAAGDRIGGPTRMALQLAGSLLERHGFDRDDIGARYLTWWKDGGFDTGTTAARVFSLVAAGSSFEEAAARVDRERSGKTAGCNPAHRIAPLAMCSSIPDPDLAEFARAEAQPHPSSPAGRRRGRGGGDAVPEPDPRPALAGGDRVRCSRSA